jgi:hypothetical protein
MAQDYSDWLLKKSDVGTGQLLFDVLTSAPTNYKTGIFSSNNVRYSYLRYRAGTVFGYITGNPNIITSYVGNSTLTILTTNSAVNPPPVTPVTVPGTPTGVSAFAGNASATVTWTAPVSNGGSVITGYTITPSVGAAVTVGNVLTANFTGLANGTPLTFTVIATNSAGNSLPSTASSSVTPAAVPGAPTGVSAVAGNASATVTWSAPASSGGSAITGYTITPSVGTAVTVGNVLTANFTGLANGTPVTFTVIATNSAGNSLPSTASSSVTPATVPGAPTGVSAVAGNASATVTWTAPVSNGGFTITGYTITPSVGTAVTVGNVLSGTVTGLTNGTPVTFTVIATNSAGNSVASTASSSVTPATVPGAPTGVSAVAGNASATVSWSAPVSNGGSVITGYRVTPSVGTAVTVGNVLSGTVTGLTNGTPVTFTVIAINSAGNSVASTASASVTPAAVPGAPTDIFAPYVDVTLWPPYDIVACANQTNHKFFSLGFLVSNQTNNLSWGGYYPLNDLSNTWYLDRVTNLRAIGGNVIFSFGGATGQEIAEVITDIPTLVSTYQTAINLYSMTAVDFDIEGPGLSNLNAIDRRNKALFLLKQQNPNLKMSYTLPVAPSGLTAEGIHVIDNMIANNVNINLVNLMTMDYGMNIADMAAAAISAVASVNNLLQTKNLTNVKVGMTNMIGVNDTPNETFTLQNASTVLTYVNANQYIGLLSIWSANRDIAQTSASSVVSATRSGIVQSQFEFINIFKAFSR